MEITPTTTLGGGRYAARAPLGRGGMGEVWRCLDTRRAAEVAVKVVRDDLLTAATRRLFYNEVLATARLDHPVIAPVYDLLHDERGLALVLELRAGEPLSRVRGLTLRSLQAASCQVLEALAYAHARGVLHLDIKPDNILIEVSGDEVRATLLDFGIARAWRRPDDDPVPADTVLGTFAYMAPEQLTLTSASLGPWTDLYALGATLYRLVSGQSAFATQSIADRPYVPPPRLAAAALGLPDALAELLEALLKPTAHERPTHAADVLRAMRALPTDSAELPWRVDSASAEPETLASSADDVTAIETAAASGGAAPLPEAAAPAAPLPRASSPRPGEYALFGLREAPLVGRERQQAAIWKQLLESRSANELRVVALVGPSGVGKSRLARDTLERSHEAGLAHTAQTVWGEGHAANDGLSGLLEHALGLSGARGLDLNLALTRWMARYGGNDERFANDVRLLLDPRGMAADADLPLRVCTEAIGRLAASRGVVLWLDEADRSAGAFAMLLSRLRARGGPIAIVATFAAHLPEDVQPDLTIALAPLADDEATRFVRALLDVSPALARDVAERAEGNPLLATQLIADLVEEGSLERSADGYVLPLRDRSEDLPADLEAVWERRLARAGLDATLLGAVALIRPRPTVETVERLGHALAADLAAQVLSAQSAGLLSRRRGAYEWIHWRLRAHLCARLTKEARARFHAASAAALASLVGVEDVQAERAHHLHGAGQTAEACAVMTEAIVTSYHRADRRERERRSRALLAWSGPLELARYRARALAELAHLAALSGDRDAAAAHVEAARAAEPSAWVRLREAQVAALCGDVDRATSVAADAHAAAIAESDLEAQMHASGHLALAAHRRRDIEGARALFEQAAALATEIGDGATEARALMHLANMAPTESLPLFERALAVALAAGARREELATRQVLADALYLTGDRDGAARQMKTVGAQARALGIRQLLSVTEIQLACWALREGDAERAATHRDRARGAGAAQGGRIERCMLAAIGCAVAALEGEPDVARAELDRLEGERGDTDTDELREVLETARAASEGDLAEALDRAIARSVA